MALLHTDHRNEDWNLARRLEKCSYQRTYFVSSACYFVCGNQWNLFHYLDYKMIAMEKVPMKSGAREVITLDSPILSLLTNSNVCGPPTVTITAAAQYDKICRKVWEKYLMSFYYKKNIENLNFLLLKKNFIWTPYYGTNSELKVKRNNL